MRRRNGGALALALCVAGTGSSGCSYLFVDTPPARTQQQQPRPFACTTSNTWPTIDVVLSGVAVLDGIGLLADESSNGVSSGDRTANYVGAGVAAASAALFAASAASGYRHTAECREATAELMNRLYLNQPGQGYAPNPYAPGMPQPYDPWTAQPPGPPPAVAPPAVEPPSRVPAAPPPADPAVDPEAPR